jgi:hypothetical protein
MRRQVAKAVCSAVLGFMVLSPLAIAQQNAARNTGDRQIYSSIKELMESIIDPSADALWGAVGTIVDKDGIHESIPKTQE